MDRLLPPRPRRTRTSLALLLAGALALGACAAARPPPSPAQALAALIAAGDLDGADALIERSGSTLDARRALDLSIRAGDPRSVRRYLPRTGVDVELDLDGTTPLIRTVLDAPAASRASLVALLIEAGARTDLRDRYGRDARTYATLRNRAELVPLLDGSAAHPPPPRPPAFAAWLGPVASVEATRGAVSAGVPSGAAAPLDPRAAAARLVVVATTPASAPAPAPAARSRSRAATAPTGPAAVAPPAAEPPSVGLLMRRSPWLPPVPAEAGAGELAALRFHADGSADLLRHRPGSGRFDPMPGSYVAWRLDGGTLRLAIVGDAFSAACTGTGGPPATPHGETPPRVDGPSASRPAGAVPTASRAPPPAAPAARASRTGRNAAPPEPVEPLETLALVCEERAPVPAARAERWSLDLARALLLEFDAPVADTEPRGAALLALATGRGAGSDAPPADPGARVRGERLAVALQGSPPGAACRPGAARPPAGTPQPRVYGDWHALDVRRFESAAPLSGRFCLQTAARDAAMAACREAAGPGGAESCRSVGGCPSGQASALAALPGVGAGWVGCDPVPSAARLKALAACRAELGCDCQLVALAGHNVNTSPGGTCGAPAGRRR